MEKIAVAKGFKPHDVLLGPDATYARVTTKIRSAAAQLEQGDIFLFTFSGHGYQKADSRPDKDEEDELDETILLFDVLLLDDVFRKDLWPRFKAGVRVLMVADSCHSGSNYLNLVDDRVVSYPNGMVTADVELTALDEIPVKTCDRLVARTISNATAWRHWAEYNEFYQSTSVPLLSSIEASVLHLAACEDDDRTADDFPNGVYTTAMLKVLKDLDPANYDDLVKKIQTELTARGCDQIPLIDITGPDGYSFRKQKPFMID
jgi:hypothetical protein